MKSILKRKNISIKFDPHQSKSMVEADLNALERIINNFIDTDDRFGSEIQILDNKIFVGMPLDNNTKAVEYLVSFLVRFSFEHLQKSLSYFHNHHYSLTFHFITLHYISTELILVSLNLEKIYVRTIFSMTLVIIF